MSIRRSPRPQNNFYLLDNRIAGDERLSWQARGLLIFLLTKPDHWEVSVAHLIKQTQSAGKRTGRDGVYSIINELLDAGYLRRIVTRGDSGEFGGINYEVFEGPEPGGPLTDNAEMEGEPRTGEPHKENPFTANPTQVSTEGRVSTEKEANTEGQKDMLGDKHPTDNQQTVFIYIPTNRFKTQGQEYPVTDQQVFEWQEIYPAVNVRQTLKQIRSWNMNNPSRRKTMRGVPAHIDKWLAREQNRGGFQNGQQQPAGPGLDPNDLSWADGVWDDPLYGINGGQGMGGQHDQQDSEALEGDFSRVDSGPENTGFGN